MTKFLLFIPILLFSTMSHSQINELGLFVGGSNFIGDIGATTYVDPKSPAIGIFYKWNKTPRHSWRFSFIQSKINPKDIESDDRSRKIRDFEFENTIKEISGGIEFNFFDFDINNPLERKLTPYVFTGLSMSFFNGTLKPNVDINEKSIALPIILGVKSNLTSNFVVGFEIGVRYTFSDGIDGSFRDNTTTTLQNFGNLNNNDWYVFSGLTLSYTFGQKPCFCAE